MVVGVALLVPRGLASGGEMGWVQTSDALEQGWRGWGWGGTCMAASDGEKGLWGEWEFCGRVGELV